MSEKIRSFIAIEIPKEIRKEVYKIVENIKKENLPIRWVNCENLHITLAFLGEVTADFLQKVKIKLAQVAKQFSSFSMTLKNFGFFPTPRQPRVFWLGVEENKELLTKLAESIIENLKTIGFKPEERKFHPHLTLGRCYAPFNGEKLTTFTYQSNGFKVDKIVLFKSTLTKEGPIYEQLASYYFKKD